MHSILDVNYTGTKITRAIYEAKHKHTCGGDCWNDSYVARKAFADPEVSILYLGNVYTGLYIDVYVQLNNGNIIERRIYG